MVDLIEANDKESPDGFHDLSAKIYWNDPHYKRLKCTFRMFESNFIHILQKK